MKIIARFVRRSLLPQARSRRHRRNCRCPRISSGSSVSSMPLACLLIRRDSLSDPALRPRLKPAVVLIFGVAARSIFGQRIVQSKRGSVSLVKLLRFAATARPPFVWSFPTTLLGGLPCQLILVAFIATRLCWAAQPCWRYLTLCRLQALKINSPQQLHQRRRKRLKSRRRLLRLPRRRRFRHHRRLHRRPRRK